MSAPSFGTSFFMDLEHGVICPLSTFSHGMIQIRICEFLFYYVMSVQMP